MPDENKEGAAGNQGGAGAGAGDGKGGDETVTMKKSEIDQLRSDLTKSNEDRDNYKKIGLQKKADERNLDNAGAGGKDGEQANTAVIDEKKIVDTATAAANKALRNASERTAKRTFLSAHPEYVEDSQWTSLMSHLTFKGGEVTHEEVLDRMEGALLDHKRSTGKLDEYMRSEHDRGVREGRIQGEIGSGQGTGGGGDRNEGASKGLTGLSEKGKEMARAMHVDPEKAAKMDPLKDNQITDI